jgi:hypothetical protein
VANVKLSLASDGVLEVRALIHLNWDNGWPMIDQSVPLDAALALFDPDQHPLAVDVVDLEGGVVKLAELQREGYAYLRP